jgi:hypothetical protein
MHTLLTPGVVSKSKPRQIYDPIIELWLVYPQGTSAACAWLCRSRLQSRPHVLPAGEEERLALHIYRCPSVDRIDAISTTTEPKQRDLAHGFNRPFT